MVRKRPPKPEPKPQQYPTKQQLTLKLIETFKQYHPEIHIKLIKQEIEEFKKVHKQLKQEIEEFKKVRK